MIDLQLPTDLNSLLADPEMLGGLFAAIAGFIVIFIIVGIAIYIYQALAFMKIAEKTNTENGWLAFIPIANLYLMSKMAKMHWWPILLIIAMFIPFIGFVGMLLFVIYTFIWEWKIFEAVGRPGWWVLWQIIPLLGTLIFLILLGVAAWGKKEVTSSSNIP